ncbi:class I adenylate-forming enzyme family protein [Pseudoalteromonas sp. T1lg65]|uniref:class I adenylate-forming enzyme family protein n=1 Tax=Pseudoalteromonas sp. T1lg65 TaxID=2077101 RepID=UPI003F79DDB7
MQNLYEYVAAHAKATPQKAAVIYEEESVSYAELIDRTQRLIGFLTQLGIQPGHRVALFAPNGIEYAVVMLASAALGVAVVPLPITLKGAALASALKSTPVALAISWSSVTKQLLESGVLDERSIVSINKQVGNEWTWPDAMAHSKAIPDSVDYLDSPFILTMTSGSTGNPKPITLSQRCKLNRALEATVSYYRLDSSDVVLVSTPLYHSLAQRGLLMPLLIGATTVILPKFNVAKWLDAITSHKVSFLFAVSSQLEMILPELSKAHDLSSLKTIVSSSAVLPAATKTALVAALTCRLHECYGASEVGVVTDFCVSIDAEHNGSVGKALPFVELKVVDKEGNKVAANDVGEIRCKTITAFSGYLKLPKLSEEVYDHEGFFATGDLGYLDKDGYLYYVGRNKDVISSGGINVYPQDIEDVIKAVPGVDDCVAFSVPEAQLGEVVKVVYTSSDNSASELDLRKACLQELTDYQQPRTIQQVSALPKSSLGKILRQQVKEMFGE